MREDYDVASELAGLQIMMVKQREGTSQVPSKTRERDKQKQKDTISKTANQDPEKRI